MMRNQQLPTNQQQLVHKANILLFNRTNETAEHLVKRGIPLKSEYMC